MRVARLISVAALVVGAGSAIGAAVACGSGGESGADADAGIFPNQCDPNLMVTISCSLPCGAEDVEPVCENGTWVCPAQPTEPMPEPDSVCQGDRGDASRPECWDGPAECVCDNESRYVWYCSGDGGFVDTGPPESGVDAPADAPGDAPSDVADDAAAE